MIPAQREPYINLSKEDKELLGENYRKNRKKKNPKRNSSAGTKSKLVKKKQSSSNQEPSDSGPSLVDILSEVKALDIEIASKCEQKYTSRLNLQQLKMKMKLKTEELDELDSTIVNYTMKCQVLRKTYQCDN